VQWMEIKVTFSGAEEQHAVEWISEIFQDLGTSGVVVDDPRPETAVDWGEDAVAPPEKWAVTGYLQDDERFADRFRRLESALAELQERHALAVSVVCRPIREEDWAESWKAFFYPEPITPNLVVKPTWREYTPLPHQQVIEIDPGMAFGTGTHPTTALCVALMEKYIRQEDAVLDVGTGSGILLIAAAKLGASRLAGVDVDPTAVAVARDNLLLNRIAPESFTLVCGHLIDLVEARFDLVVANILADVIVDLLDDLPRVLAPGGVFVCSGIIEAYRDKVVRKMESAGLRVIEIATRGDWVAIAGRRA
jgi:ribosomal protein L11 methyltransferase